MNEPRYADTRKNKKNQTKPKKKQKNMNCMGFPYLSMITQGLKKPVTNHLSVHTYTYKNKWNKKNFDDH